MQVWCVVVDGMGAHEPQAILSIWTSLDGAIREVARLNAEHPPTYYDYEYCFWVKAETDMSSDMGIA
jgi:hypothetical protein